MMVIAGFLLLLVGQDSAGTIAEQLGADDPEVRSRQVKRLVERGLSVLPILKAIEQGEFSMEAKQGAGAAIRDILHRHRIAGCRPPEVKVSVPAGEYGLEKAAALALKPFGIATEVDPALSKHRFRFSLETSSAWAALHAICRDAKVSWRGDSNEKGSFVLFHEIPQPVVEKMFAIVGPYRIGGVIRDDWVDAPLLLYLSAVPGLVVSSAHASKLTFKDADGLAVPVEKVDHFQEGGGRQPHSFGFVTIAVVRGKKEDIKRIHQVEGELKVVVPETFLDEQVDLASAPKEAKIPLKVGSGTVEILKPLQDGQLNLYIDLNGTKKTFLSWVEDEQHQLLQDALAWEAGTSGNVQLNQIGGTPRWLVVARIDKTTETTYPFDCRRQKP